MKKIKVKQVLDKVDNIATDISSHLASLEVGELSEPIRQAMSQEVEQRILQLERWQTARTSSNTTSSVLPRSMVAIEQRLQALEQRLQAQEAENQRLQQLVYRLLQQG